MEKYPNDYENSWDPIWQSSEEQLLADPAWFLSDTLILDFLDSLSAIPEDFSLVLSEETHPAPTSMEPVTEMNVDMNDDVPFDLKEWQVRDLRSRRLRAPRLFEFLLLLLRKPHYQSYASYSNAEEGVFLIHQPDKVASLWEQVKNRQSQQTMTYDKFARAVRWYYQHHIMEKTNTRYTFKFSSKLLSMYVIDENNNIIRDFEHIRQ